MTNHIFIFLNNISHSYGIYFLLILGTAFIEGETFIFAGGYLAREGILSFPLVVLCGGLGGFLGDILFFHIGRHYRIIVLKHLYFRQRFKKVGRFLTYADWITVPLYRFLYGLRIPISLLFGLSKIKAKKFIVLNGISAPVWATIVAAIGYGVNHIITHIFRPSFSIKIVALGIIVVLGLLLGIKTLKDL